MITLVFSDTKRSLTYLDKIIKNKIRFQKIILYSKNKGIVYEFIKKKKLTKFTIFLKTNNVNSNTLEKKLKLNNSKINVVCTYPGEIVKNPLVLKYKLLHCHPGDLPMFKGSTTIYYTLILKREICVSLFLISEKIDCGKILYKKYFKAPPNKIYDIEQNFDNEIRALTLIEYLKSKKDFTYSPSKKKYLEYYIAHPLIRQIVLNKDHLR